LIKDQRHKFKYSQLRKLRGKENANKTKHFKSKERSSYYQIVFLSQQTNMLQHTLHIVKSWDPSIAKRTFMNAWEASGKVLPPIPDSYRVFQTQIFSELPYVLLASLVIYRIRRFLSETLFSYLADRWNVPKGERHRFIENAWFSFYYPLMVVFSFYVLWDTPWLWNFNQIYIGFPHEHIMDDINYPLTKIYRFIALAFYSQALFSLIYYDERMKDFGEMVLHHLTTITLMLVSNLTGIHRLGSVVILLHDIGDVFLYNAKMFHTANIQSAANTSFFLFASSFFILRLVLLPYTVAHYILYPGIIELYHGTVYMFGYLPNAIWPVELSSYGICVNGYCLSTMYLLGLFVYLLVALHWYWFYLILQVLQKALSHGGNVQGDVRQQDIESTPTSLKKMPV
jgi:hypothetical protein